MTDSLLDHITPVAKIYNDYIASEHSAGTRLHVERAGEVEAIEKIKAAKDKHKIEAIQKRMEGRNHTINNPKTSPSERNALLKDQHRDEKHLQKLSRSKMPHDQAAARAGAVVRAGDDMAHMHGGGGGSLREYTGLMAASKGIDPNTFLDTNYQRSLLDANFFGQYAPEGVDAHLAA